MVCMPSTPRRHVFIIFGRITASRNSLVNILPLGAKRLHTSVLFILLNLGNQLMPFLTSFPDHLAHIKTVNVIPLY